ncbi:hypothetical protein C8Q75DRAFT_809788 [Abortiporus biennis]|nr:hypothetical protein C8Q75DRAFT_809788 [Abortiporus biennis]
MATTTAADNAAQLLFPPNVQYNASKLYTVKFLSSCLAGAVAGVLGLENWLGFALFIFSTLFTSTCLSLKCKGKPAKFVQGGLWELVNPGQENTFSFVLAWTLFYGIVHEPFFDPEWKFSVYLMFLSSHHNLPNTLLWRDGPWSLYRDSDYRAFLPSSNVA